MKSHGNLQMPFKGNLTFYSNNNNQNKSSSWKAAFYSWEYQSEGNTHWRVETHMYIYSFLIVLLQHVVEEAASVI